jgi:hypothetical protein
MQPDRSWFTVLLVTFGIRWFLTSSSLQPGKRIAGTAHFEGSLGVRLLIGLGAPTAFYGAGTVALSSAVKSDWWVCLVLAGVGTAAIAIWPEEITASSTDVSQSRFFGLGKRTIRWSEVDYASENPANGNIEVAPKEGKKIVHTRLHVGHEDFLAIVRRQCRMF